MGPSGRLKHGYKTARFETVWQFIFQKLLQDLCCTKEFVSN